MAAIEAVSEEAGEEASTLFRSAPRTSRFLSWVNPRGLHRVLERKESREDPDVAACLARLKALRKYVLWITLAWFAWIVALPLLALLLGASSAQ